MNSIPQRIKQLREQMEAYQIDAYLIASDDFHGSEYVSDYFKCREYFSGFTGSAGTLLVLRDWAGLWTDGRYFLQAGQQLENTGITLMKMGEEQVPTIRSYLKQHLAKHSCVGYDGRTMRVETIRRLKEELKALEIRYVETKDLVGTLWENRPPFPQTPVWELPEKFAGQSRKEKLKIVREKLRENKADAVLLASLDDIAWLYNLRGGDIAYNPVFLSYSIVFQDEAVLYRNQDTIEEALRERLSKDGVRIAPYGQVYSDVKKLDNIRLLVDESTVNLALCNAVSERAVKVSGVSPTVLLKAIKNPVERENVKKAHILDGVAVTKLLYWLKTEALQERANVTELDVCRKLEAFRSEGEHYLGQSFAPIVAAGAHGAIVHYEPTAQTNQALEPNQFVLMDTGGQYLYGTTDITRTAVIGQASEQEKIHYTAVLKGHIRLAAARFKYGYSGVNLDILARSPLWEMGLDYNHGTGHGVGYLLNVHEGPQGVRQKEAGGKTGAVLEEGMLISDEPGLYLEGAYGIRIENMLLCTKAEKTACGQFMKFETLTMVPYEREAIVPEMLTKSELDWLDSYHRNVYETLAPYLDGAQREWLKKQTAAIQPE